MTLPRLIYIIGFVLIVYSLISGLSMHYYADENGSRLISEYSFNIGSFLLGLLFIYFGKRMSKKGEEEVE